MQVKLSKCLYFLSGEAQQLISYQSNPKVEVQVGQEDPAGGVEDPAGGVEDPAAGGVKVEVQVGEALCPPNLNSAKDPAGGIEDPAAGPEEQ